MTGELSIMYLLSQDSLVSKQPTIKCDINALDFPKFPQNLVEGDKFPL